MRGLKLRCDIAFVIRFTEISSERGEVSLNVYYREREKAPLPNSAHSHAIAMKTGVPTKNSFSLT